MLPIVVIALAVGAIIVAVQNRRPDIIWGFIAALTAFCFSSSLKLFLHRTRPDTLYVTTMRFKSYSFPSGHAFGTTLIYGLLIYLVHNALQAPWNYLLVLFGMITIITIGLSRIYLGAHFPSDILGGWLLGLLFLLIIITFVFSNG
jgi:undecaprenyl-diphosphatase